MGSKHELIPESEYSIIVDEVTSKALSQFEKDMTNAGIYFEGNLKPKKTFFETVSYFQYSINTDRKNVKLELFE